MRNFVIILLIASFFLISNGNAQRRIVFWNVENLFDTINSPDSDDGEFTPTGRLKWNSSKYWRKVKQIKEVITQLSPTVMGFCEIENARVIKDILPKGYRYLHYDSDDWRGIDVALIYRADGSVQILRSEPIKPYGGRRTRDLLRVDAKVDGVPITFVVVHLPSRRGNNRSATAHRNRINYQLDSLSRIVENIVIMGDFNQNPSKSLLPYLHNCMADLYKKGEGSYAYRDRWQMYDQIFVSHSLRTRVENHNAGIYSKGLIQKGGRFRGYPAKGRPSDHLPVYIDFLR